MTIYETIMTMLHGAAENMLRVQEMKIGARDFDNLLSSLAGATGVTLPRGAGWVEIMGYQGYVRIVRGE